jgi:rubrerythrin
VKKLAERHPEKLLDLLGERLTFERSAVKLYDTILAKMRAIDLPPLTGIAAVITQVKEQRDQEKEHEEWLEEQIRALGGDAQEKTDMADLIERESKGVIDVIEHDTELPHLFHALLTAELVDDSGWKLLLELADEADDDDARRELRKRAEEEEGHLLFLRTVVTAFARTEVLGRRAQEAIAP